MKVNNFKDKISLLIIKIIRFWIVVFYKRNPELYGYIIPCKDILIDISIAENGNKNSKKGTLVEYACDRKYPITKKIKL